jgi:hypothetical protein
MNAVFSQKTRQAALQAHKKQTRTLKRDGALRRQLAPQLHQTPRSTTGNPHLHH